jgi:hypothetical protein
MRSERHGDRKTESQRDVGVKTIEDRQFKWLMKRVETLFQ